MMEQFAPYAHAIVALAGMAILTLLMSPLSAMRKTSDGLAPGCQPEANYENATYRWHRAYSNLTETTGSFALVVAAAILSGADPFWVNLLASAFLASRILLIVVHVKGIGKPHMGVRSFTYVFGWVMCLGLAALAILAVF